MEHKKLPSSVGRKFHADGRVYPFAGNTVVCHLDQHGANSAFFHALLDIYRELPACTFARRIAVLPTSSYHVTMFGGANDQDRKTGTWPADLALDLPMAACDDAIATRLRACDFSDIATPIRLRIKVAEPSPKERPIAIHLIPFDDAEERKLRALRDRISQVTQIRAPDHDTYFFHVTLAYMVDWMTAEEQANFNKLYKDWHAQLAQKFPVIELGRPEFCTMKDMFAFHRQFYL